MRSVSMVCLMCILGLGVWTSFTVAAPAAPASPGSKEEQLLTPWERYAQVLLMSNELMFVD